VKTRKGLGWFVFLFVALSAMTVAGQSLTVTINDGEQYAVDRLIEIQLTYVGNQLPTEMRVFAGGDEEWSEWVDYADSIQWSLVGPDGVTAVQVEVRYWLESQTGQTTYGAWRVVAGQSSIFLDMTPPVLTYNLSHEPNENGWYKAPIGVAFTVSDSGSGIAESPADYLFQNEGAAQSQTFVAVDKAGNRTEVTVDGISLDMTPPVLTYNLSHEPNENGWYKAPVRVEYSATDNLAGIAHAPEGREFGVSGVLTLSPKATDKAGNAVILSDIVVKMDVDAPLISVTSVSPGASPCIWTHGPVTVSFAGSDGFSGLASPVEYIQGTEVVVNDGADQTVTGRATDLAGNETEASVLSINIDSSLPTTTVLVVDAEGASGAQLHGPVPGTVDLGEKLDSFGDYDADRIALGYAFVDAAGEAIADLNVHATILIVRDAGKVEFVKGFHICEYAPAGGFYYFVVPSELERSQVYEVWFEDTTGAFAFKAWVRVP
jgi:CheY-specific phosphatase CheX